MTLADIAILALKSAVVAGLGLILARLVARRAADRVLMLRSAVVLTVALPFMAVVLPVLDWALLPAEPAVQAVVQPPMWSGVIEPVEGYAVSGEIDPPGPEVWTALAWLAVSAALGVRLALGLTTLMHWSREGRAPRPRAWGEALTALAGKRRPRLVVSDRARGPLSWGLPPGAILIDRDSERRPETAPAVIAHELAHLKRGDWVFLMLSRLMLAMFWFNPLCWRLHAELVARSEEAADAEAVRTVDRSAYARALVELAVQAGPGALPASGMAASPKDLKQRITSLMKPTAPRRPVTLALSLAALAVAATPIAALEITRQDPPPAPPEAPLAPPPPEAADGIGEAPLAPLPPEAPEPPAPPAPPARTSVIVLGGEEGSPEITAAREDAYRAREDARRVREEARATREAVRAHAEEARRLALVQVRDASRTRAEAEQIRIHAQAAADHARVAAEQARGEAERAMAEARVEMGRGADQMRAGADQMREEARRLRDADYRARVIAENRERGQTVTDEDLRDLSPRLMQQADDLDRQADALARQARDG